jgi:hypothetical protein
MTPAEIKRFRQIAEVLQKCAGAIEELIGAPKEKATVGVKQIEVKYTPWDLRTAEYLHTLIHTNYPFMKVAKDLGEWADEIRKIRTLEGNPAGCYDRATITSVIEWCQNDHFWKKNIRSARKFRAQFEGLLAAGLTDSANKGKSLIRKVS